jgi:LPS sulfotransferase NodH
VGKRHKIPRRSQKYAFRTKSSYVAIPANVMGISRSPAYQKIMNASGNQGEPLSFFTTPHAENKIAKLMTSQRMSPPMPISTTSVPKPLSTPMTGVFALKKRATY